MDFKDLPQRENTDESTEIYTNILSIVYPTFLSTTIISHSILLIFIIFFSPPHLKFLRILLLKTSIFDVLATIINAYIQPRIVSGSKENVPVYCYGPCRNWSPSICFPFYMAWQTISLAVGVSMTYTIYFKYHKLSSKGPLVGLKLVISLFSFYFPCLISMCCAVLIILRNELPNEKRLEELIDTKYIEIGRMTLGEWPNRINFIMMSFGIYIAPFMAFWFRWKSNKHLKEIITGASPFLLFHIKNVLTGLTIQVSMHFLFYIPMFSLYFYSLSTGTHILIQQFFLAMSPNLAATFDSLINLYYVIPYRNRIKSWFTWKQPNQPIRVASITPSG